MSLWRATYRRDGKTAKFTFAATSKVKARVWAQNFVTPLKKYWKDTELLEVLPVAAARVQERLGL